MSASHQLDCHALELPLPDSRGANPSRSHSAIDLALEIIGRDLALWGALARHAQEDPRLRRDQRMIAELGRDLRSLRDCYLTATHPRVRQALLREAGAITLRMKTVSKRLRIRGMEIRALETDDQRR
jgi:hypothetical protein